jgi:hypothetical protein
MRAPGRAPYPLSRLRERAGERVAFSGYEPSRRASRSASNGAFTLVSLSK